MKRILSYILSILLLVSCSNNDFGNVQNSIQKSPKEASYLRQIQQLNEQYIHHVQKSSRAQGDDNDNDNDVNGWEVAFEDTSGACAVGKAALFYTRNPSEFPRRDFCHYRGVGTPFTICHWPA